MLDMAIIAKLEPMWVEAAANARSAPQCKIYPSKTRSRSIVVLDEKLAYVRLGSMFAKANLNTVVSKPPVVDEAKTYISAMDALSAQIALGVLPPRTAELTQAAKLALAANAADDTPVAVWAKKLATSAFKR